MQMSGLLPTYEFDFGPGVMTPFGRFRRLTPRSDGTRLPPVGYLLSDLPVVRATGKGLTDDLADLRDVVFAVYAADRMSPRTHPCDPRPVGDRQCRRLVIRLPLRQPERWQEHHVQGVLETFLGFLSNDIWDIHFSQRLDGQEFQAPLFQAHEICDPIVSLFSGGLDSFLGVIEAAFDRPKSTVVASSVTSSHRLCQVQADVVARIQRELGSRLVWAPAFVRLFGGGRNAEERESSWRTRSFLFLAEGAITSVLANAKTLQIVENGVGAISLPYSADQIGASTTRATHPKTLALFSALVEGVLDSPLEIINPALWRTKGQMCRMLEQSPYLRLVAHSTVSCDRFAYAGANHPCGRCTSCHQRNLAMGAVGYLPPALEIDRIISFDRSLGSTQAARIPLYAMRDQVERLRAALEAACPERAIVAEFPDLVDVVVMASTLRLPAQEILRRIIDLYRSYVAEWDAFLSQVAYLRSAA